MLFLLLLYELHNIFVPDVDGLIVGDEVWIYDAVGRCVNSFVAEEERYVLNVKEGAYVLKTSMESVKFVVW